MTDCLILNADASPLCLLPISARPWHKVVEDIWNNKVQVLHTYDDWIVRSPSMELHVPSVVVLNKFARPKRYVRFSPRMMKLRDDYTCQYCSHVFPENHLTMDHVVPHSHGGPKNWENIVAACQPCNGRRGNNTKIRPNRMPYKPTYWELVAKMKQKTLNIPHESWAFYLDWPENLLKIRSR